MARAAVSHCSHNGEEFRVGQVTENCEDRCTCLATGRMDCTPLCPESELPEVRDGCSLVYEEECSCNATEECPNGEGELLLLASELHVHRSFCVVRE